MFGVVSKCKGRPQFHFVGHDFITDADGSTLEETCSLDLFNSRLSADVVARISSTPRHLQIRTRNLAERFFVIYGFESGFSVLLFSAELRKMRAVAQKLGCRVRHMFWCGLAGGFATIFAKLCPPLHDVEGRPCCVMNDVVARWFSKQ